MEIVIPAGDRAAPVEVVPEIVHLIEGTLDEDEHGWKPTAPREEDTRAYPLAVGPKRTAVSKWNVGIVRALPGARSLRDGACPGRSTRLPTPRARLGARLSWLDLYDLRRLAGYLLFDCQPTEDLYRGFVLHDDLAAASNREKRPPAVLPMSRVDWRRPGKMQTKGWFKAAAASVGITSGKELAVLGALARVDVLRSKSRADPRTVEAVLGFSEVSRAINYWRR